MPKLNWTLTLFNLSKLFIISTYFLIKGFLILIPIFPIMALNAAFNPFLKVGISVTEEIALSKLSEAFDDIPFLVIVNVVLDIRCDAIEQGLISAFVDIGKQAINCFCNCGSIVQIYAKTTRKSQLMSKIGQQ